MKKKFILLFLVVVTLMTACSDKKQTGETAAKNKLPKNEESLTWWSDRTKPFGSLDYPAISEKEALDLMANKFKLKVPDYFDEAKKIVEKNLIFEGTQREEVHSIFTEGDNLVFTTLIQANDSQNNHLSYAKIELRYEYIPIQKKVKLLSQELSLYNQKNNEAFSKNNLTAIVKEINSLLHLKDQDKLLTKFTEEIKDDESVKGKDIVIVRRLDQSYKKKIFGQNFGVIFKGSGEVESVYSIIKDERL